MFWWPSQTLRLQIKGTEIKESIFFQAGNGEGWMMSKLMEFSSDLDSFNGVHRWGRSCQWVRQNGEAIKPISCQNTFDCIERAARLEGTCSCQQYIVKWHSARLREKPFMWDNEWWNKYLESCTASNGQVISNRICLRTPSNFYILEYSNCRPTASLVMD